MFTYIQAIVRGLKQDEEAGENTETEGGGGKDRLGGGQREALMNEASSEVGGTEANWTFYPETGCTNSLSIIPKLVNSTSMGLSWPSSV